MSSSASLLKGLRKAKKGESEIEVLFEIMAEARQCSAKSRRDRHKKAITVTATRLNERRDPRMRRRVEGLYPSTRKPPRASKAKKADGERLIDEVRGAVFPKFERPSPASGFWFRPR